MVTHMRQQERSRYARWAFLAVALCFTVVVLGAFVRLSHAGLGCPDWPGCYGQATWPTHAHEIDRANRSFPARPVVVDKAWREMVHRFCAGALILLVFGMALAKHWQVPARRWQLAAVPLLVAVSMVLYVNAWPLAGLGLLAAAWVILLRALWVWSGVPHGRLVVAILALILLQALFGQWTVTLKLKPIVVTTHLLLGMGTLALLSWFFLREAGVWSQHIRAPSRAEVGWALLVVALQVFLGGWLTANYAALSCGVDFPRCIGQWWPSMDWREAWVLWRGIGVDYEGGVLDGPARVAIQMSHRLFALVVLAVLVRLAWRMLRQPGFRTHAFGLLLLLAAQIALGIANIRAGLPLPVATLHNAGAAMLLLALVALLARVTPRAGISPGPRVH